MKISRRELDNKVNKLNKRLETIGKRLGRGTFEYESLSKAISSAFKPTNDISGVFDMAKEQPYMNPVFLWRFKDDHQTINLSRSYRVWQMYADKYGEESVMKFLNDLLEMPTYVEHADRIQNAIKEEQEDRNITADDIRQYAEAKYYSAYTISRAFDVMYLLKNNVTGKVPANIQAMAARYLEQSHMQMKPLERLEFNKNVVKDAVANEHYVDKEGYTLGGNEEEVQEEVSDNEIAVTKWRRSKSAALRVLERKQYVYEKKWTEAQQGKHKITVPMNRDELANDIETIRNANSAEELSANDISALVQKWSGQFG